MRLRVEYRIAAGRVKGRGTAERARGGRRDSGSRSTCPLSSVAGSDRHFMPIDATLARRGDTHAPTAVRRRAIGVIQSDALFDTAFRACSTRIRRVA